MNRLMISGLALALLTGGALAQAATPAPAGMKAPPPPGGADAMNPGAGAPPLPPPGGMRAGVRLPPPGGPGAMDDDGPGGPPPPDGPRGRRPPPSPAPKAAHFRIERGDTAVDIKCADDEPMKACAEFTLQLLDKLQAMPDPAMPGRDVPKP